MGCCEAEYGPFVLYFLLVMKQGEVIAEGIPLGPRR